MDKKTIVACVLILGFLTSGGGIAIVSTGLLITLVSQLSAAVGADEADGGDGGDAPPGTVCDPGGASVSDNVPGMGTVTMTPEQMGNAAVIVEVGEKKKVPEKGLVIAIMTALQESTLHNLHWGDRDSQGLFQQRPAAGWGSPAQITNPSYAAGAFFGGPEPPSPRGLLDVKGWEEMSHGEAAQTVQVSAFPDAYDKWQGLAGKIVGRAKNIDCEDVGVSGDAGKVIEAAKKQLGVPYCWAGGDANGPTYTKDCPSGVKEGFDCSGLTLYAYAQVDITLGHYTGTQYNAGTHVQDYKDLKPGDLMFFSSNGTEAGIHHVSIYMGGNKMIHAPRTGKPVQIVENLSGNDYWMSEYYGSTRLLKGDNNDKRDKADKVRGEAVAQQIDNGDPFSAQAALNVTVRPRRARGNRLTGRRPLGRKDIRKRVTKPRR
ncbi:C40 family peptidase [Streptomyces sp. PU-14G]|uniref:C40 family peptidase n=1 Tax=Streptomyces sp. PU-14G TaxID=2800808 RepID=UPI0034DEE600